MSAVERVADPVRMSPAQQVRRVVRLIVAEQWDALGRVTGQPAAELADTATALASPGEFVVPSADLATFCGFAAQPGTDRMVRGWRATVTLPHRSDPARALRIGLVLSDLDLHPVTVAWASVAVPAGRVASTAA